MTLAVQNNLEPSKTIAGYELVERIGVGGYGEVWKANAPGGLSKAIKLIYGHFEDNRASRELKSLNRIRELNHPFLLTLERIEIVNGQVMIVTELADQSMNERFDACRQAGLGGIPRDELLRYLKETADALDYIYEKQSLQHLDIKPANLLLVGDHVKVADFGLLKDLHDYGASQINGLTPSYAAPELFDSAPSRYSDQYSLAIVYQEMLTGHFPYNGKTVAQLASQHVHSSPDLSTLSPQDRFAVGKALNKDANRRFRSCREFVERLEHRSSTTIILDDQSGDSTDDSTPNIVSSYRPAQRGNPMPANGLSPAQRHDGQTIVTAEPEIRDLPPIDIEHDDAIYRPTVFVGLGGFAGAVLGRLRQLVADRCSDVSKIPALRFLYFDTDIDAISRSVSREGGQALGESDVLLLPLRQTTEYRSRNVSRLRSVSRRWLYNIPKSLRTEGMRALGRVAFLDHSDRVLERLRATIAAATDNTSIETTSKELGINMPAYDPQIFLVSSIVGGTGSGMVVDMGYAVRQVLAELGLRDDAVCGMLSIANPGRKVSNQLAAANVYACIEELRHFNEASNDFPGEPSVGLAGFQENKAVFTETYLVDSGDETSEQDTFDSDANLAEYLFLNCLTPASKFFKSCRDHQKDDSRAAEIQFRTFGFAKLNGESGDIPNELVERLCTCVVKNWRGGVEAAASDESIRLSDVDRIFDNSKSQRTTNDKIASMAIQMTNDLNLNPGSIESAIRHFVHESLSNEPSDYFNNLIEKSFAKFSAKDKTLSHVPKTIHAIEAVIGTHDDSDSVVNSKIETLQDLLDGKISELVHALGNKVHDWIMEVVDSDESRVEGARNAVEWLHGYFHEMKNFASSKLASTRSKAAQCAEELTNLCVHSRDRRREHDGKLKDRLHEYAIHSLEQLIALTVKRSIGAIEPYVTNASDELRDLWKDLSQLMNGFGRGNDLHGRGESESETKRESGSFEEVFEARMSDLMQQVDRQLQANFFDSKRRLRTIFSQDRATRDLLATSLRREARQVLLGEFKTICLNEIVSSMRDVDGDEVSEKVKRIVDLAIPELLKLGGAKRLLIVCPKEIDMAMVERAVERASGEKAMVMCVQGSDIELICEAEQIDFERVGGKCIRRSPDCFELASRLHTRVDIDW